MINKLTVIGLVGLTFLLAGPSAFANAGIFGSSIGLKSNLFNSGGNTFFEASLLGDGRHAPVANASVTLPVTLNTAGFNGLNLGSFNPATDTLTLIGGGVLTFKNDSSDVTGTFINYSIDGGSFQSMALPFNQDNVNGNSGDQRWASTSGVVNLLTGLSNGSHTIAFFASGNTNNVNVAPQIFDSNGNSNYTANFTVVPEPSTYAVGGLALLAVCFQQRRRFSRLMDRRSAVQ